MLSMKYSQCFQKEILYCYFQQEQQERDRWIYRQTERLIHSWAQHMGSEKYRQAERQTDRRTHTKTDRKKDTQTGRKSCMQAVKRQRGGLTDRRTDRQVASWQAGKQLASYQTDRQRDTHIQRETDGRTYIQSGLRTDRQTWMWQACRQTGKQTDRKAGR